MTRAGPAAEAGVVMNRANLRTVSYQDSYDQRYRYTKYQRAYRTA